jgi:hypothetical protein
MGNHPRTTQPTLGHLARHLLRQTGYSIALVGGSLLLGMAGYHWIAHYAWIDAFLNTCMLLAGMGPIGTLPSDGAKLFAGVFALYAGLVFLIVTALALTPVFHWVLHRFHWDWTRDAS